MLNTIADHTAKMQVVPFSKLDWQNWNNELRKAKIPVGNEKISMNKETSQWFRV